MTSRDFFVPVSRRAEGLRLALVAETWHCRPSELLELRGAAALRVDLACAAALWEWRSKAVASEESSRQ